MKNLYDIPHVNIVERALHLDLDLGLGLDLGLDLDLDLGSGSRFGSGSGCGFGSGSTSASGPRSGSGSGSGPWGFRGGPLLKHMWKTMQDLGASGWDDPYLNMCEKKNQCKALGLQGVTLT